MDKKRSGDIVWPGDEGDRKLPKGVIELEERTEGYGRKGSGRGGGSRSPGGSAEKAED